MTSATAQNHDNLAPDFLPAGYKSTILQQFVNSLGRWQDAQILDIGPVCQENITYFAIRMKKHYACDMFLRLKREGSEGLSSGDVWRHLDYPPRNFDGIQLWDLIDHLDDGEVSQLVSLCYSMLRATGLLMLIAFEKEPALPTTSTFVIGQDYHISLRPQPHLKLSWHCRHNRALMSLMGGFNIVKSFQYRNGLREFLYEKPGLLRDE